LILGAVDFESPLTWAILIGWIMSVVLHEFAHGIVAYWGGDYTIRERGGLTLNPFQYIDPLMSIILPIVFLLMGGIPLPGGATYVRRDLLRSRAWDAAVSAAGPAMNFILFILLSLPFHPSIGWITADPTDPTSWKPAHQFLATMALLQMISVILNLIPIPPLDGFQVVGAFMNPETRYKLMAPPYGTLALFVLFLMMMNGPLMGWALGATVKTYLALGFDDNFIYFAFKAFAQSFGWG
jgi:Zn-dependent protease